MPIAGHSPDTPFTPVPCQHIGPDGTPRHVHGERSTYRFDKCRCLPCRESIRVYDRQVTRARAYGTWQPFVDAGPAHAHAVALRAAGMSRSQIQAASGVGHAAVGRIVTGRDHGQPLTRLRTEIAARILAVPIPDRTPPVRTVPSVGTIRRIQALVWLGWSLPVIGGRIGMDRRNTTRLLRQDQVTRATEAAVRRVYGELWDKQPPTRTTAERYSVSRSRGEALRRGWVSPLAWDDDTIDDPDARPQGTAGALTGRRAAIVEDCELIASDGGTLQAAAQRLGMHQSNLSRSLYRAGRADLLAELTRQARAS